ncbi:MAG: DUF1800 domain-containing protein [Shinella sp.]|uniref:DUF1800 domain-containing protein n=1 Tax=Shinella sp. TaxID=1870904 RepID=UPI0040357AAD
MPTFASMAAIRFGYGRRPGEAPPEDVDTLIRQVERGAGETCLFPYEGIAERRARFVDYRAVESSTKAAREAGTLRMIGERSVNPYSVALNNSLQLDRHRKVQQAVLSPNGFFERLAAFWCDHFAIDTRKGATTRLLVALFEAEAVRPNIAGRFDELLKAAVLHPAMLIYLDQIRSVGPNSPVGLKSGRGLNENLARELIELHTMGAGSGYTQTDVRAAAYVLTGLWYRAPHYNTVFRTRFAEPDGYEVLGRSYGGADAQMQRVHDLLDDLAAREETRRHICRKLVVHFIADDPPQAVVEAMVVAWTRSDGALLDVYRAMLEHPRSFAEEGQKARQPFDFVVAALRAVSAPKTALRPGGANESTWQLASDVAALEDVLMMTAEGRPALGSNPFSVAAIDRLGQPIWSPPSPAGWAEDLSAWVTASQLTERIAWARRLVARFGGDTDPRAFLEATLSDAARADTIETVSRAPNREVAMAMVLASPEFNRR